MLKDLETSLRKSFSMAEYATALTNLGIRVVPGSQGTQWLQCERYAVLRVPVFHLSPPESEEIRLALRRAAVAGYLVEPGEQRSANARLYVCNDSTYSLEKLTPAMRRNVRCGLRELKIRPLTPEQVLAHGGPAFCDTRRRAALTDGTAAEFDRRFGLRVRCPAHVFLGAWKGESLAAFLSVTEVEDWAEIEGCFSMDAHLHLRPNDVLMYSALSKYLINEKRRLVSYGVSSIQTSSNAEGLHAFKTKVGFQAQPVHRAFVLHSFLRPFAGRLTLWGLNIVRRFQHGNRRLSKAHGMLALCLNDNPARPMGLRHEGDQRNCNRRVRG